MFHILDPENLQTLLYGLFLIAILYWSEYRG